MMISSELLMSFHFECLHAGYWDEIIHSGNHLLLFSSRIADHYCNKLVALANTTVDDCLAELPKFVERGRSLTVYITPSTQAKLQADLASAGFLHCATDRWFISDIFKFKSLPISNDITFKTIIPDDNNKIDTYIDTFKACYGGSGPNDVYQNIDQGYAEALRHSFTFTTLTGYQHSHVLAYLGHIPVGIVEVFVKDGLAGIYGVGTIPQKRGKGIGKSIMVQAAKIASAGGATQIFLLTEAESYNDAWYTRLGFSPSFDTPYFRLTT